MIIMEKNKGGRPTKYTKELAEEICAAIASSELGLIHIVAQYPHWPDRTTIFSWIRGNEEFRHMYARAKEDQCEVVVEYMQEVMNESHKWIDENGNQRTDVPMLRLKMDTMKWHASKLKPKKFGDHKQEDSQEKVNASVHEEAMKRKQELDDKNRKEF